MESQLQNAMAVVEAPQRVSAHIAKFQMIEQCASVLLKIPQFQKLRMTLEMTQHLASILLHASELPVADQDHIIVEVLSQVYQLSDEEKTTIQSQIDFIRQNRLAKKLTFFRRNRKFFFGFLGGWRGKR